MRQPSWSDAALPVVAAAVAALLTRPWPEGPWADFGFVAIVLSTVLFLVRAVWRAHRQAGRELDHARGVAGLEVGAVAAAAVGEERSRMLGEIDATVRASLQAVRDEVAEVLDHGSDPLVGVRAVQAEARRSMTELRRQLGLLRDVTPHGVELTTSAGGPSADPGSQPPRVRLGDVLVTGAFIALAAAEGSVEPGPDQSFGALLLTLAYYVGLLVQRSAPVLASAWMTAVLATSVAIGVPVLEGLVFAVAYGLVLWRLVSRPPRGVTVAAAAALAGAALAGAVLGSRWLHSPDNLFINAVVIGVVVLTGSLVGASRRSAHRARREAAEREAYLQQAREAAVRQERQAVARELHDVASHAVSLIAVQAGAAEVLWTEGNPGAADATRQLEATAAQALTELDALRPGATTTPPVSWSEVEGVVRRMEAAGLRVQLEVDGEVPSALVPTSYRVVQEALTNALRHAPDSPVRVTVTAHKGSVEVVVRNDVRGPGAPQRGFGLIGLQERVTHAGGTLEVGHDEAGGFTVRAGLPVTLTVDT